MLAKIIIHIRKNSTGEIRTYEDRMYAENNQLLFFLWEEGNYACDCNRQLFWNRVYHEEGEECECSYDLYDINIYTVKGKLLYHEFEEEICGKGK